MSGEGKKRVRRLVLGVFILLIILGLVFMYAYAEYDEYVEAVKSLQFNLFVGYYPLIGEDTYAFFIVFTIYNPSSKDLIISDLSLSIYMEDYQITTLQCPQLYVRMGVPVTLTENLELKTSQIARFLTRRQLTFRAVGTAHLRIRVLSLPLTISIPIDSRYVHERLFDVGITISQVLD
jgi:LEA14-like dessication related protein